MKILKAAFNFYLDSSIHVALAVVALVYVTVFEYELTIDINLVGFIFFGTISGYNFVKYAGVARFHHRSLTSMLRAIQLFSLLAFITLLYFLYQLPQSLYWYLAIPAMATFLYAVPIIRRKTLRMFSGLKIFVVALVWAVVTVLIPWLAQMEPINTDVWLTFSQRLLFVVVITIPFEIRDLKYDQSALGTLPQQLGIGVSKWLGVVLMYVGFALGLFKDEFSCAHSSAFAITGFICALLLWQAKKDQSKYYSAFGVESVPLFYLLLFYLLKYYFAISC